MHLKILTIGGFKQPQQLISSSLALNEADLFVWLEGYNDIWEASPGCLPQSWNLVGIRFHRGLLDRDPQVASGIKELLKKIYDFSRSPFASGKIRVYFLRAHWLDFTSTTKIFASIIFLIIKFVTAWV